jgi:hypothetical protein
VAVSANIEPDASELIDARTVFRAFEVSEFLDWPAWRRLVKILGANGGSYGLSGPRGAGKSWLMLRAIAWAQDLEAPRRAGLGLWYPSPSEYNSLAFLASLSDSLATEIERWYRRNPRVRARVAMARIVGVALAIGALVAAWRIADSAGATSLAVAAVVAATAIVVALAVRFVAMPLWRSLLPEGRLLREALIVRERARYSATRREASEVGGEGGRGLVASARVSRERELIERPATLSSLVNDFRALAAEAGLVTGRVVIAIDELDKMANPDAARDLLRDIKGIFEVPRVHFLVSVSDEAARNLSLGALTERNEFNSSFYTVIQAQPATPGDCAELLDRRSGVPRPISLALAVLAGGNPREVVRLAELAEDARTGREAIMRALKEEALTLRRQVVTALDTEGLAPLGQQAREGAFLALPDDAFESEDGFSALCAGALAPALWSPEWSDAGWEARFQEQWRRLLVRLAVAGQMMGSSSLVTEDELTKRLLGVITSASQSSRVARIVLERQLSIDTPRAPGDTPKQGDIRLQLEGLARRYESVRSSMKPGSERTKEMDGIVSAARLLCRDAHYTPEETLALLDSPRHGDRVVGLATVQATADPTTFASVLQIVVDPATPFEQYHALRALESLRPGLSTEQRSEIARTVSDPEWRARVAQDVSMEALAKRLLEALGSDTAPA